MAAAKRTGRRPGAPETREAILVAARDLFAEHGYAGTSIRRVAAAAAVDPALVHHYFGTKEGLFRAALEIPIDPEVLVQGIVAAGREQAPTRLVQTFLRVWDAEDTGPAMVAFLRRVLTDPGSTDLAREFIGATLLRTAMTHLLADAEPADAARRVTLVISQMFGLMIARKVLLVEPLASMPADELTAAVTPTIARYLYGDLTDEPEGTAL